MNSRFIGAILALGLVTPSLTACSSTIENATPTPVDYKACLIPTSAGVNDGARNQAAYFGLQQATVQYGSALSMVAPARDTADDITRAGKKLVSRGCNLIFAIGPNAQAGIWPLALGNPKVKFHLLDTAATLDGMSPDAESGKTAKGWTMQLANVWNAPFDIRAAYLQAGYLAAAASKSGVLGVIGAVDDQNVTDQLWYFRQGVYQYREKYGKLVTILGADRAEPNTWNLISAHTAPGSLKSKTRQLLAGGADVILPLGVNYLPVTQAALAANARVIGADTDWAKQPRFETVKTAVLASVLKPISDWIAADVGNATSIDPMLIQPVDVTLTEEGQVAWPAGIAGELSQLRTDYLAGNLSVIEEPKH